jgi:hypothetical protein
MRNIKELCSEIARRECGKSNVKIGDIREIIRVIADIAIDTDKTVFDVLHDYAARRANKRKKYEEG